MKNNVISRSIVTMVVCLFSLTLAGGCSKSFNLRLYNKQDRLIDISTQQVIQSVKSITYYSGNSNWANFDSVQFETALAGMQSVGANTVWLVLPWIDFQPVALPEPTWNEDAIANLILAIAMAKKRDMNVILPLCYLGIGWSPQGIDPRVWTVDTRMYNAFRTYAKTLVTKILQSDNDNMIFLLYGEGSYPYTRSLRDYDVTIKSFRKWCHKNNKNIDYWNKRWDTDYTWDNLLPFTGKVKNDNDKNLWTDYWKWSADIVCETHGELAREIRRIIQNKAIIGYHDDAIISKEWGCGASPIPLNNPYHFLSFAHYYTEREFGSLDNFILQTSTIVSRFKKHYPEMPLGVFETGLCEQEFNRNDQARVVGAMAKIAKQLGIGINLWMWQDHTTGDKCQQTFGLLTLSGEKKPAYFEVSRIWTKP